MKTPVRELYERLWEAEKDKFVWAAILIDVLEKEKQVIEQAFIDGYPHSPEEGFPDYARNYYNETFNTKE